MKKYKVISKVENIYIEYSDTLKDAKKTFKEATNNWCEWAYLTETTSDYTCIPDSIEKVLAEYKRH